MEDREFLELVESGTPIEPDTPLAEKLEELGWKARWITNYLNCVAHRPPIVRAILTQLTDHDVHESVRVYPPFYVQIGLGIRFGRGVFVDQGVHLQDVGGIRLGDHVCIGCNVTIMTSLPGLQMKERGTLYPAPVVVEDHAWIGPGVTVLPGVTIGAGAVVSPGSLVADDVDMRTVAAGRPAHYVRDI